MKQDVSAIGIFCSVRIGAWLVMMFWGLLQVGCTGPASTPAIQPRSEPMRWEHGPYGAEQCNVCHVLAAAKHFREPEAKIGQAAVRRPIDVGARLVSAPGQLCVGCHVYQGGLFAYVRELEVHLPAAAGYCMACHHPHTASRRYQLLGRDNLKLCSQCHELAELQSLEIHAMAESVDCLECHNPHLGKTVALLREDFDESADKYRTGLEQKAAPSDQTWRAQTSYLSNENYWHHGPYGALACSDCHALTNTMLSVRARQSIQSNGELIPMRQRLVSPPDELCTGCHVAQSKHNVKQKELRMHGPVAAGRCNECHDPHGSPQRYMLTSAGNDLCTQCHVKRLLSQPSHDDLSAQDCLSCHNPHVGKTVNMLRKEFDEQQELYSNNK